MKGDNITEDKIVPYYLVIYIFLLIRTRVNGFEISATHVDIFTWRYSVGNHLE